MTLMFNLLVLVGEIKKRGFNQNLVMNLIIILKLIRILFKKVKFLRLLTTKTLQLVYKIKTYFNKKKREKENMDWTNSKNRKIAHTVQMWGKKGYGYTVFNHRGDRKIQWKNNSFSALFSCCLVSVCGPIWAQIWSNKCGGPSHPVTAHHNHHLSDCQVAVAHVGTSRHVVQGCTLTDI